MKNLDKERRKLEKAGFTGQTLERTNASMLNEFLVKMVARQGKGPSIALHETEINLREMEAQLGLDSKPEQPENTRKQKGRTGEVYTPLPSLAFVVQFVDLSRF